MTDNLGPHDEGHLGRIAETFGRCPHTGAQIAVPKEQRRLIVESVGETLRSQVARLAGFIIDKVEGEPSQSQGAVDTAIRIIRNLLADRTRLQQQVKILTADIEGMRAAVQVLHTIVSKHELSAFDRIRRGLIAGAAEKPLPGETEDHTITAEEMFPGVEEAAVEQRRVGVEVVQDEGHYIGLDFARPSGGTDDDSGDACHCDHHDHPKVG